MTKKIKIVHILNGDNFLKFVHPTFDLAEFDNKYLKLDLKNEETTSSNQSWDLIVPISETGKNKALELINSADLVIHYFLDYTKSELILKSNPEVKHYWYFFGADVYQQINVFRKNLYGKETKKFMFWKWNLRFRNKLRCFKYKIIQRKASPEEIFKKSLKRIENTLWYIPEEINFISKQIDLPKFEYFKYFNFKQVVPFDSPSVKCEELNIFVGNSSTIENNHLDVLAGLKRVSDYNFNLGITLAYGDKDKYLNKVKKEFKKTFKERCTFFETFVSLDEYNQRMNNYPVAIMFHFRQQALGNIIYMVANGTKMYLSHNNIVYLWLKNAGVRVGCFETEFENDCKNDNLMLSKEVQLENYNAIKLLLSKATNFLNKIND